MSVAWLLLACLCALLAVAAIGDVRTRLIPNRLNLAVAALAPCYWLASGMDGTGMLLQLGAAFAMILLFGILFALGMMGGGDVKLIAALALWLPGAKLLTMIVWMALIGGALTIVVLALHALRRRSGRPEIPYGVAIVAGTLMVMANDILTNPVA